MAKENFKEEKKFKEQNPEVLTDSNTATNARDAQSHTLQEPPAPEGNTGTAEVFLKGRYNIHDVDSNGMTALHRAAHNGDIKVVEEVVKQVAKALLDASASAYINAVDRNGNTALHLAAYRGHKEVVQRLLDSGAEVNARGGDEGYKYTALHLAAYRGHKEVVDSLLQRGAEVNAQITAQGTHWNLSASTPTKIEVPRHGTRGDTALHWAAMYGKTEVVKKLLAAEADINAANNYVRNTPLHYAAEKGHAEVVKELLAAEADINARDRYEATPLHYAAKKGHTEVVKELLAAEADINARDRYEATPLHYAAKKGHTAVVEQLLKEGANVNAVDKGGKTPLHYTEILTDGGKEVRDLLICNGADLTINPRIQTRKDLDKDYRDITTPDEDFIKGALMIIGVTIGAAVAFGLGATTFGLVLLLPPMIIVLFALAADFATYQLSREMTDEERYEHLKKQGKIKEPTTVEESIETNKKAVIEELKRRGEEKGENPEVLSGNNVEETKKAAATTERPTTWKERTDTSALPGATREA